MKGRTYQLGLCSFTGTTARTEWNLNTYAANGDEMLSHINEGNISNSGGTTNLAAALRELRLNVMSPSGGDRSTVPNVCVLITVDVSAANISGFLPEADLIRVNCKLVIIVVGTNVSNQFIQCYATVEDYENFDDPEK